MFDFSYSEDQLSVKKLVRKFVDREIMPNIEKWDEEQYFETSIIDKLADLGLMGVCIPEKYGGQGMDYITLAIVCSELERGDTAFRTLVSVHTALNSMTLLQWGDEFQKEKY
ncbi:acyl-CoA dehydrogenase family protein, partial [Polycladomyces subterraneus]